VRVTRSKMKQGVFLGKDCNANLGVVGVSKVGVGKKTKPSSK
jgi:hypothetical protein